jgi:hypothetical protein
MNMEELRKIKTLQKIYGRTPKVFWKNVDKK